MLLRSSNGASQEKTQASVRRVDRKTNSKSGGSHLSTTALSNDELSCDEPTESCFFDNFLDGTFRKCFDILAGSTIHAGTLCVSTDEFESNDAFYITVNTSSTGWYLEEVHMWIGQHDFYPHTINGTPLNSLFPVRTGKISHPRPTFYGAELPFDQTGSVGGQSGRVSSCCDGMKSHVYQLLAHCKIYNSETSPAYSEWGNATEIGSNWAISTNITLGCECENSIFSKKDQKRARLTGPPEKLPPERTSRMLEGKHLRGVYASKTILTILSKFKKPKLQRRC